MWGAFFAAAGVTLSRRGDPWSLRSRNRALRWAMGFDILESTLRDDVREALKLDDDFHDAPDPQLIREASCAENPRRRKRRTPSTASTASRRGRPRARPFGPGTPLLRPHDRAPPRRRGGGRPRGGGGALTGTPSTSSPSIWTGWSGSRRRDRSRHQLLLAVVRAVIRAERALTIE